MADAILEAAGVSFRANGSEILSGASLALHPGRVACVMGPNGSGKTTLLKIMALLLGPTSGAVCHEGRTVFTSSLEVRRRFGVVLKAPNLFRTTMLENAMEGLLSRDVPRTEARRAASEWLDRLCVGHLADRSARTLSSGEAARVSFARALAPAPKVLFLDEPFSAFDPEFRKGFIDEIGRLIRDGRTATLLVTHDREEALALGDTLAVLSEGKVVSCGRPDEVLGTSRC
ncbi:MAG: ATP-binding cassette domain-containing protein [Deltaproteobacteria bacterium]|nr:ATP-binding cassette domain-containing protein [Deltaproteobacteria bacterium]